MQFLSDFASQEDGVSGVSNRKYRVPDCIYKSHCKSIIITKDHSLYEVLVIILYQLYIYIYMCYCFIIY